MAHLLETVVFLGLRRRFMILWVVTLSPRNKGWQFHSTLLTHWGRVTHIYVSKLTIIGSDNGLSPDRRQAIIWINAGMLLMGPLGTNFSEILIEILTFSLKKMPLKVSVAKRRPFCLGLDLLTKCHCRGNPPEIHHKLYASSSNTVCGYFDKANGRGEAPFSGYSWN